MDVLAGDGSISGDPAGDGSCVFGEAAVDGSSISEDPAGNGSSVSEDPAAVGSCVSRGAAGGVGAASDAVGHQTDLSPSVDRAWYCCWSADPRSVRADRPGR